MKIAVAGHICLDIIPQWEQGGFESIVPGKLIEMEGVDFATGGAVANTGRGLKKLGVDSTLVGKIGKDEFGDIILKIIKNHHPALADSMIVNKQETSSYSIVLNPPDTDRVFLHYPGTNHTFNSSDIPYQKLKSAGIFHFGYPPLMEQIYRNNGNELKKIMQNMQEMGVVTSLDMSMPDPESPAGKINWKKLLENVLPHVNLFLPSIGEISSMLDQKDDAESLQNEIIDIDLVSNIGDELLDMGADITAIKLGTKGLYLRTNRFDDTNTHHAFAGLIDLGQWSDKEMLSPIFSTVAKGTTGSGDATIAGFLADFSRGAMPADTLVTATAVGACSVEAVDAIGGIPHLRDVKEKIEKGWERPQGAKSKTWLNFPDSWTYDESTGIWENNR